MTQILTPPQLGRLYLVPTPLDFACLPHPPTLAPRDVLPDATMAVAARLEYWLCENAKTLRAGLKRIHECHPLKTPLQQLQIAELPRAMHKKGDHIGAAGKRSAQSSEAAASDAAQQLRTLLSPLLAGHDLGLASEAGMPAIADPGSSIVRAAHDLGAQVSVLSGPISLMLALAASGLNGQNFAFCGYLPQEASARAQRLRELEKLAQHSGQSQIFIETPYRNHAMLDSLLQLLSADTRLSISWGLTLEAHGLSHTASAEVRKWRSKGNHLRPEKHIESLPAVYIIGL
jgi:16S rRNA (cytidine1402-2'-O)-methyltransferase